MMFRKSPKVHEALVRLAPGSRQIVRNLVVRTDGTILAGYRIGATRWDFTGAESKSSLINRDADVYSHLTGREMRVRVSTRPHPIQSWARSLNARTPNPTPDVHTCDGSMTKDEMFLGRCGCETWNTHLLRMQDVIARSAMDDKVIFRYFSLTPTVPPSFDLRKDLNAVLKEGAKPHRLTAAVMADEEALFAIVKGWTDSKRMSEFEQGWLRMRSLAPGMQPTGLHAADRGGWDEASLPMLANDIRWDEAPFGRVVNVNAWMDGKQVTTAARVLTVARLSDLHYPENGLPPWMVQAESVTDASGVPFSVEWSLTGRLYSGEQLSAAVELELRKAQYINRDYKDHDELPPVAIERAISTAISTRDQVTGGQAMEAARFQGQISVIISGSDRYNSDGVMVAPAADVVEERAAAFTRMYAAGGLRMDFTGPQAQVHALQRRLMPERLAELPEGQQR